MEHSDIPLTLPFDLPLIQWLQSTFGASAWNVWNLITELGAPPVIMVVLGIAFWSGHRSLGVRLLVAVLLTGVVVDVLKVLTMQPRPYYAFDAVMAWRDSTGFGMPSGHAAGAMTLWLLLLLFVRRWWFTLVALSLIALIGISRIYFGVHSPTQVGAGWVVGLLVALLVVACEPAAVRWFQRSSQGIRVAASITCVAFLLALQLLVFNSLAERFELPDDWQLRYQQAVLFEDQLDGEEPDPDDEARPLPLFDAFNVSQTGIIAGTWLLAILLHGSVVVQPRNRWHLTTICLIGVLCIGVLIPLLGITEDMPVPGFLMWMLIPTLLAIAVPRLANAVSR